MPGRKWRTRSRKDACRILISISLRRKRCEAAAADDVGRDCVEVHAKGD